MTPGRAKPPSNLPNWISGKVTFNAAAVVVALGFAMPKAIDFLDARYATREERRIEITTLRDEIKSLHDRVNDLGRVIAGLDSSDKCYNRKLKGFCR
jgi:hypothetical protein